jgi:hypothetical protein
VRIGGGGSQELKIAISPRVRIGGGARAATAAVLTIHGEAATAGEAKGRVPQAYDAALEEVDGRWHRGGVGLGVEPGSLCEPPKRGHLLCDELLDGPLGAHTALGVQRRSVDLKVVTHHHGAHQLHQLLALPSLSSLSKLASGGRHTRRSVACG